MTTLDILNVFVEFPGNLLFFLLVMALSQGSLFLALGHRSRFPFEQATRRYVIAATGLVILWLIMLGAAFLTQFSVLEAEAYMPPMERLVYAITLLILAWCFLSADFHRWQNRSNLLVFGAAFVLVLLYINSARGWLSVYAEGMAFNASDAAQLWSGVTAALAGLCALLAILNIKHIVDAPLKVLFFLVFIIGNGWDFHQLSNSSIVGNYLGAARLAYLAGLILLPVIIYRLSIALLEHSLVEVVLAASQPSPAVVQSPQPTQAPVEGEVDALLAAPYSWNFSATPVPSDRRHLLSAIGIMLETSEGANVPEQIVKAALETLQVEICALLRFQENSYADVIAGYDRVAEQSLSGVSLNLNEQPTLREAAARREQTILFPEYHAEELTDLYRRLSIPANRGVYAQPLTVEGELVALMLVAMPYRQTDLSPEELESLRDIGYVAANLLAWSFNAASSKAMTEEDMIDQIASRGDATTIDQDALNAYRLELEASLESVRDRSGRMARQIVELKQQQEEQHIRLLDALAEGDTGQDSAQRLNATFDEQSQLRESFEASARALLDAESLLRVLNAENAEALAQVIREYMHKEYNLFLATRDRLRRQINALLVMGRSVETDGYGGILQTLADESAQLELEREQQQRRLDSIVSRLESMGLDANAPQLTQLLIQLYAERTAYARQLAEVNKDRDTLLSERRRFSETSRVDSEELERQLRNLSADHEQLLNSREQLRREKQDLLAQIDEARAETASVQVTAEQLAAELAAQEEGQKEIGRRLDELAEERDNLLKLRDQLTAKVNETLADDADHDGRAVVDGEVAELSASVERLTAQREQLALELSDARTELSVAQAKLIGQGTEDSEDSHEYSLNVPALFSSLLDDLRTPMTSISDYTDLLLAESIGILGAAQQQVIALIASDISRLAAMITEIQKVARLDGSRFALEYGNIDLISIIEDVIEEEADGFTERRHIVEFALGDQLPPISADGASLKHIVAQLIANASAVSPAGSKITVSANFRRFQLPNGSELVDAIEIRVADKGGGISLDDIQRVFARKYRTDNREIAGFGDVGVGMTVARAYARAQNGDLWLTTEAGEGSVFHLALPLQLDASIEE